DEAVAQAEQGLAIISSLPDRQLLSTAFLQTAKRYLAKGELFDSIGPDGSRTTTPESQLWYRKAVQVLQRGVPVDREVNATLHAADVARGRRPDQIPIYGYEELYQVLGRTALRAGDVQTSLGALQYQRRMNPLGGEIYRDLARAYMTAGRPNE